MYIRPALWKIESNVILSMFATQPIHYFTVTFIWPRRNFSIFIIFFYANFSFSSSFERFERKINHIFWTPYGHLTTAMLSKHTRLSFCNAEHNFPIGWCLFFIVSLDQSQQFPTVLHSASYHKKKWNNSKIHSRIYQSLFRFVWTLLFFLIVSLSVSPRVCWFWINRMKAIAMEIYLFFKLLIQSTLILFICKVHSIFFVQI